MVVITRVSMAPSGSKRPNINAVTVDLQEIELELRPHGSCQYHAMRATALQVLQPTFGALERAILIQTTYLSHQGPRQYPKETETRTSDGGGSTTNTPGRNQGPPDP